MWYFVGIDYQTGKTVWQARSGAGGLYNDGLQPMTLGPDGTLYQGTYGGVAILRDGA